MHAGGKSGLLWGEASPLARVGTAWHRLAAEVCASSTFLPHHGSTKGLGGDTFKELGLDLCRQAEPLREQVLLLAWLEKGWHSLACIYSSAGCQKHLVFPPGSTRGLGGYPWGPVFRHWWGKQNPRRCEASLQAWLGMGWHTLEWVGTAWHGLAQGFTPARRIPEPAAPRCPSTPGWGQG